MKVATIKTIVMIAGVFTNGYYIGMRTTGIWNLLPAQAAGAL